MKTVLVVLCIVFLLGPDRVFGKCPNFSDSTWDMTVVEIIKMDKKKGEYRTIGTGIWLVGYDSTYRTVLLSCRHVLMDTAGLAWRCNTTANAGIGTADSVEFTELFQKGAILKFASDSAIDLGALLLPLVPRWCDSRNQGASAFADSVAVKRGEEVYFLGFPDGISIRGESVPVYRHGYVALDRYKGSDYYLIDATVIGGSSGSPVFNCNGKFMGILKGFRNYYFVDPKAKEIVIDTVKYEGATLQNTGLGAMIPSAKVEEFLREVLPNWPVRE